MRKIVLSGVVVVAGLITGLIAGLMAGSCAAERQRLEDAPIITSATYQHTQYNGRNQPIEARAAREDAAPFVVTYFRSEEDLECGLNGRLEPPVEVGDYYVRIERPEGNGYRQGNPIKIEYHIQKAFITIEAEPVQRVLYDGSPKEITAATEPPVDPPLLFFYFAQSDPAPLPSPPAKKGVYRVVAAFPGNERYMGASRDIELRIE